MPVYDLLGRLNDVRKEGTDCDFNGFLEDYLNHLDETDEPSLTPLLKAIFAKDENCKIIVNLKSELNNKVISNQIIHYKDAFKIPEKKLTYPVILYTQNDKGEQRALMLIPYSEHSYLYAKGMYYCLTEPYSELQDCKNEIVSLSTDSVEKAVSVFSRLFTVKAGALQREIDREYFKKYDELKADALAQAQTVKTEVLEKLEQADDPLPYIVDAISKWFLLKKVLYVQYMVNKDLLEKVHAGNIKKQRNQAKINSDEVTFISYSEMWKRATDEKGQVQSVESDKETESVETSSSAE